MKKEYDGEKKIWLFSCGNCKYFIDRAYKADIFTDILGSDGFLYVGELPVTRSKHSYHEIIERETVYACPKCGCLQIEI